MKKIFTLTSFSCVLMISTGCFSTFHERKIIAEEIFGKSKFDNLYAEKSYFALLPSAQRKEYIARYKAAVIDFYAQNLTASELESLSAFQDDPVVQQFRKDFWSSKELSQKSLDNIYTVVEMYPVIKKISSEQFQNDMTAYTAERVLNKTEQTQ
jgi:putative aminopeptidase FrvX